MQPFITGVALLAALTAAAVLLHRRSRGRAYPAERDPVRAGDVRRVFDALVGTGREGSFVVFIFNPADRPSMEDALNVGFSIDGGRPGFDWLLATPGNIADRERFAALAESEGRTVAERETGQGRYLRVEDGDLPGLCALVLARLYGLDDDSQLDVIVQGFEWG